MHTAPFSCTAHLACLNLHVWRRCSCRSTLAGPKLTDRRRCLRRWLERVDRRSLHERLLRCPHGCHHLRLGFFFVQAGGDESHKEACRRLHGRIVEKRYLSRLYCARSAWCEAAEGRAHGRPCIWGFQQPDLVRGGILQDNERALEQSTQTPHAF